MNPFELITTLWPQVRLYDRQKEIVESVWADKETFVVAGNQLGKDFVAGLVALTFFLVHPVCRVVTTSVKDEHLDILWGEIDRFIKSSLYPIANVKGAPLLYQYRHIRKINLKTGIPEDISYLKGMVSKGAEGMSGHHAPATLWIADEASGISDKAYEGAQGWAKHMLVFGNPFACGNFYYKGVKQGSIKVS